MMAKLKIKVFAEKHDLKVTQVYTLLAKNKHLKCKVKGLGTLVDEEKYLKLIS